MKRAAEYGSDWLLWWRSRGVIRRSLPAVCVLAYWAAIKFLGGFRGDHLTTGIALLVLAYGGPITLGLYRVLLPFILTGMIYDSQRYFGDKLRGRIHVATPYLFDKRYFGIPSGGKILTPNEFLQHHLSPILDLITGFFYLAFFVLFILLTAFFYFHYGKVGTRKVSPETARKGALAMAWAFFWVNIIGYSTYYWYPAAPPWYVARYGLGPARLDVHASAAGAARFDQLLGTHFFAELYGRAADVFGAVPSLHVAYPLLACFFAFRLGAVRLISVSYFLVMCFAALYLDHHYMFDLIWGWGYAILVAVAIDRYALHAACNPSKMAQMAVGRGTD